jgi:aminomethyltransferase
LSVGTAFHPRTSALHYTMAWGEWSGYFAAAVYADFHDIEYNAIREAAAVIDVSPLYKYRLTGPDVIALAVTRL